MSVDSFTLLFMMIIVGALITLITIGIYHGEQTDKNALFKDCNKLIKHINGDMECQK